MKLTGIFLLAGAAMLHADQIQLKNGDRVTGKVVKKDGATLIVKSDLLGELTVKWADVVAVSTDDPVTVALPDDKTVKGKIATEDKQLTVKAPSGDVRVPLADVQAVRNQGEQANYEKMLHPPLTSLWTGFFDLGLATAQGNAKTLTFTSSFNATRATLHDKVNIHFNEIYSRGKVGERVAETAKAMRGGWSYNRSLSSRLFINTFNDYEHDAFQSLDLRFVAGGGLGYKLWKRDRGSIDLVAGGDFDRDKFAPGAATPTRHSGEAYWGDDLSFKLGPRSSIKQSFRMFDNLTTRGDYRVALDMGMDTHLTRWLAWQVSFSDRYVTNPADDRKSNDVLLSTGFRITFTH